MAATNIDIMLRCRCELYAGLVEQLLRYDELGPEILGERFETAGGVHGIADRGNLSGTLISHLANNGRPGMEADADPQW